MRGTMETIPTIVAAPASPRTLRLRRIHPVACGKLCAGVYGLGALLMVPVFIIVTMITLAGGQHAASHQAFGPAVMMPLCFAMPILAALIGFFTGAIGALIYNVIARFLGGAMIDVDV
jgi:hypothetical protein